MLTIRQKTALLAGLQAALTAGLISWGTYHALMDEVLG
jgi:hypothetical protein